MPKPSEEGLIDISKANKDPNERSTTRWQLYRKRLATVIRLSPIIVGLFAVGYPYYYNEIIIPNQIDDRTRQIRALSKAFRKDVAILKKYPLFKKAGQAKNAGLYLNGRIPWINTVDTSSLENDTALEIDQLGTGQFDDGKTEQLKGAEFNEEVEDEIVRPEATNLNVLPSITLSPEIAESVNKSFPSAPDEPLKFDVLDLEWFQDLKNYDHWDIESSQETQYAILAGKNVDQFPEPDYVFLQTLARIELLRGAEKKDQFNSIDKVYNLAFLINSHETEKGHQTAHKILNDVLNFVNTFDKSQQKNFRDQFKQKKIFLNQEVMKAHQRMPAGYSFLMSMFTIRKVEKFLKQPNLYAGKCIALKKILNKLSDFMPVYIDIFQNELFSFTKVVEANTRYCRLNYSRSIWKFLMAQPKSRTAKEILERNHEILRYGLAIPFPKVRKFIGQIVYVSFLDDLSNPYAKSTRKKDNKNTKAKKPRARTKKTNTKDRN